MTDTRMVRLEQIAAFPAPAAYIVNQKDFTVRFIALGKTPTIRVKQVADPTGGDVFQPVNGVEAGFTEYLRRAKWPHLVQVEVVNG